MFESHRSPVPARRSSEHSVAHQRPSVSPSVIGNPDSLGVLTGLSESIQAGHHRLDPILAAIADAALHLTAASGSAIAMWKDGAMVCRARSGDTAPALGASLRTDSGISGACLSGGVELCSNDTENDERVDAEACRILGLRSIAVAPIVGWHGINGILEVFSSQPNAFTEEHLAQLKQLAGLAEKARALRPHSASAVTKDSGQIPVLHQPAVSDRVRDVVFAAIGSGRRRFVLTVAALLGVLLLGGAIWLGLHNPDGADAKAVEPAQSVTEAKSNPPQQLDSLQRAETAREVSLLDKPRAGTPVKPASKLDRISSAKTPESRVSAVQTVPDDNLNALIAPQESKVNPAAAPEVEAPPLAFESANTSITQMMSGTTGAEPALATQRVSQGVSDGFLVHRVTPRYPPQALEMRLNGKVRVDAVISEDGRIENLNVIEGSPLLARAATDAIRQWRYKPYKLDGKPVKMATTITVKFALP